MARGLWAVLEEESIGFGDGLLTEGVNDGERKKPGSRKMQMSNTVI